MNKMDDNYIADNNVIESYIQKTLTPEETIEFEEYMLDKPELLERVELDSVLIEHLPNAFKEVKSASTSSKQAGTSSLWQTLWSNSLVHSTLSFAFGAVVILLIYGNKNESLSYMGTIDLVEVSPLRSSSAKDIPDATYSLSNKAEHIMLLLQPGFIESESVLVRIAKRSDNTSVFSEKVAVNSSGDLVVHLQKSALKPGMLEVSFGEIEVTKDTRQLLLLITP